MANTKQEGGPGDLPEPRPLADTPVVAVYGCRGQDPSPGYVRLYLGLDLRSYIDLRQDDIVQWVMVDDETKWLRVYIKASAKIDVGSVARQLDASLLQGSITSAYLARSLGGTGAYMVAEGKGVAGAGPHPFYTNGCTQTTGCTGFTCPQPCPGSWVGCLAFYTNGCTQTTGCTGFTCPQPCP
jgi:hypothetical protein